MKNLVHYIMEKICQTFNSIGIDITQKPLNLQISQQPERGHFSFSVFEIAKQNTLTGNSNELAKQLAEQLKQDTNFADVSTIGGYINIFIKPEILISSAFYFASNSSENSKNERIMIEFLSPNTNKPLHLGHLRNMCLGNAVSLILKSLGYDVTRANLVNDRGAHICKSMLTYMLVGNNTTPHSENQKGDHFVGHFYVLFNKMLEENPTLEKQAEQMLQDWELGKTDVIELWEKMNKWVLDGFDVTCERMGIVFDKMYFESNTYKLGKDIVEQGLQSGIFIAGTKGEILCKLPSEIFGANKDGTPKQITLLRDTGTSLYITQDIGTAIMKVEDFNLNRSVYVVGSEQNYHFKCLFYILKVLGYEWAKNCYHLSYGMVNLPEGKMKSREGTVVDADDLIQKMVDLANEAIIEKHPNLSKEEILRRAEIIGIGALKFYLLFQSPEKSMMFNPKESISFDGKTGPYCQYVVARCSALLTKAKQYNLQPVFDGQNFSLTTEEQLLLLQIIRMQSIITESADKYNPSIVARHIWEIAKSFNQWYHTTKILDAETPAISSNRLYIVSIVKTAITKSLSLLGIQTLDEM